VSFDDDELRCIGQRLERDRGFCRLNSKNRRHRFMRQGDSRDEAFALVMLASSSARAPSARRQKATVPTEKHKRT
jgi:hypothetical protein